MWRFQGRFLFLPDGCRHKSNLTGKILAVRREDSSVWERRAPLSPASVRQLTREGVKVLVQPSNRRAYPMQSYANAGAIIQEDISEAPLIVGVKQVPIDSLIPYKTYCFFSHTIKAQEANMPLLDAILEKNIRLIDYEKLVDAKGQRIVAFGMWAGVAGMINILHGLGLRLLALGHHTPFMHVGPAHNYRNSGMARQVIRDSGYEIALGMMPKSIGPLTFVFTGSGNVSQGAQEIFQEFPHEYVPPEMLQKVAEHGATTKLYACAVSRSDHLVRKDGGPFDPVDYDEHPENYYSTFSKKIAPFASVIINGIYWAPNSPRLVTIPDAKYLLRPASTPWLPTNVGSPPLPHRLLAICDISADPGGSIEFMTECTTIDTPFCLYDADQHQNTESQVWTRTWQTSSVPKLGFAGPGVLVCSIDNMPTQLPREATDSFGELLYPHIADILQSDATKPLEKENFTPIVQGAIIASNGQLTPNFQYIQELRNARSMKIRPPSGEPCKKVLVLGAGYVSAPTIEYLTRDKDISVTIASALKEEADILAKQFENTEPILLDIIDRPDLMENLIENTDLVISLLPYSLHPKVAEQCIKYKTNMVTASYLSPKMKELHEAAVEAGITIVNEVGLDPGIDHFLAMECFDDVHLNGGKIKSFISYCGGLPAPECSNNPLRYKFSWSPRGVLSNVLSPAQYLKDSKVIEIAAGSLLDHVVPVNFLPGFNLEGFPNRDSTLYSKLYGIIQATTLFRGTLRFTGFSTAMNSLLAIGLLDANPHPSLHPKGPQVTWRQFLCTQLGLHDNNIFFGNLKSKLSDRLGNDPTKVDVIEQLGLLSDDLISKFNTPLDTLSHYLNKRLAFEPGERDLVVLHHEIGIQWPDMKIEKRIIDLVSYGNPDGYSAMAKTVGYPTGITAKMVIDGEIQRKGMIIPMTPDIYTPVLKRLKQEGIKPVEYSTFLH
uniref:Alpha-aminoadipic semialdehyde synthase n=1 Tax=Hemiscolopendra marginata TaxID=943146 RepID=A0A646QGR2_9MYRI